MKKILLSLCALAAGILLLMGCSTKVAYATTSSNTHWTASYQQLNGSEEKTVTISPGATVEVKMVTEGGFLQVEFLSHEDDSVVVGQSLHPTEEFSFVAETGGKYTITVTAEKHKGAFTFSWA